MTLRPGQRLHWSPSCSALTPPRALDQVARLVQHSFRVQGWPSLGLRLFPERREQKRLRPDGGSAAAVRT